jgi:hypothetical protein
MPQLGFKRHFAPLILSDKKPFTLRAKRKDGREPKAGQMLYMFTDLRQKTCKRFTEKLCRFAVDIRLHSNKVEIPGLASLSRQTELDTFARLDGFEDFAACRAFHQINSGDVKTMRLIAWITRDELKELLMK